MGCSDCSRPEAMIWFILFCCSGVRSTARSASMNGGGSKGPEGVVEGPETGGPGNPDVPCARDVNGKLHAKTNTESGRSFFATILVGFPLPLAFDP